MLLQKAGMLITVLILRKLNFIQESMDYYRDQRNFIFPGTPHSKIFTQIISSSGQLALPLLSEKWASYQIIVLQKLNKLS